ncbi:MAG: hypothetical protein AAF921_20635 [Cyanobacteria bacterium P01_D01_bin.44]
MKQSSSDLCSMAIPHYSSLGSAIQGVCQAWCDQYGYSDPFCRNGEWWAFPPGGVMPVRVRTVMSAGSQRWVQVGPLTLILLPDGSLA